MHQPDKTVTKVSGKAWVGQIQTRTHICKCMYLLVLRLNSKNAGTARVSSKAIAVCFNSMASWALEVTVRLATCWKHLTTYLGYVDAKSHQLCITSPLCWFKIILISTDPVMKKGMITLLPYLHWLIFAIWIVPRSKTKRNRVQQ